MKVESLKCPECGGIINDDSKFCNYCGARIVITDENTKAINYSKVITDESEVLRAKNQKYELEQKYEIKKKDKKIKRYIWLGIILLLAARIAYVNVPKLWKVSAGSHYDYENKNYEVVEKSLRAKGFTDIELIDLNDTDDGWYDDGEVEDVSIDGNTRFDRYNYFSKKAKVIISYH